MRAPAAIKRRHLLLPTAILFGAHVAGCGASNAPPRPRADALVFSLEAVSAGRPGRVAWLGTYDVDGVRARFRIELSPEPAGTTLPTFIRCALVREAGSDGSALVRDLSRALGARRAQPGEGPVETLELVAALLGRDLSRGTGSDRIAGFFTSKPAGTWIATKLFFADDAGEMFMNLDPVGGYGEFALKDPNYGPSVVREMSRLLLGEAAPGTVSGEREGEAAGPAPTPRPEPSAPDPALAALEKLMAKAAPGVPQPERQRALQRLAIMGPRAAKAIPVFLAALTDEDAVIRSAALEGFTKLKPDPQIGIVAVKPLLKDPFATNQTAAARAMIDFGETQAGVTYLVTFLHGSGRSAAAAAIAQVGPDARSAVPGLIQMLESARNADERYWACRALAAIGRDASAALPLLEAAAASSDPNVRAAAQDARKEIRGYR